MLPMNSLANDGSTVAGVLRILLRSIGTASSIFISISWIKVAEQFLLVWTVLVKFSPWQTQSNNLGFESIMIFVLKLL